MRQYGLFFTATVAALSLLGSLSQADAQSQSRDDQESTSIRPNVVMIAVDDMNDMIGALGGPAKTPNIDRLAERGVNFTNAHVTATYCTPSRTSLLTGLHPANSGWYSDQVYFADRPDLVSLPRAFKDADYHVYGGGKVFHHMPGYVELGAFDEFFVWDESLKKRGWPVGSWNRPAPLPPGGQGGHSEIAQYTGWDNFDFWQMPDELEDQMADTITAEWAAEIVNQQHEQAFFLAVGIYAPHKPNYVPRKYYEMYPLDQIEIPAGVKDGDLDDVPSGERNRLLRRAARIHEPIVEHGDWERAIQGYLAAVSYADAQVGKVLDALDAGPNAEDTVIVFWSDHGYHLGEKQKWAKHTLWQRTTNAPFIWAGPGVPTGRDYDGVVSFLDVYPTLLSMAGIEPPHALDGQSLLSIFNDPDTIEDRAVSTANKQGDWAVMTDRWRYIYREGDGEELYDVQNDPHEWDNLASDTQHAEVMERLKQHYPQNPVQAGPEKNAYRLVTEGETFRWEQK